MVTGRQIDRRKAKSRAFRLGQPLFMRVSKTLAAPALAGCALIAISASYAAPAIGFEPFFLLICAFGAWLVGNRFAVLLSVFIASVQIMDDRAVALQEGALITTLKFLSVMAVVLMLGVARAALEIEWRFARVDPLTGALNRKAFFEAVQDKTAQTGLTILIYADVNGLKRLNDRQGHEAGDEALREFADRVRKTVRKNDVFARIGGDEFVICLAVCDIAAAELVAQRLNAALNSSPLDDDAKLRCSLGVLVLPAGSRSIDAELKQADTLMYHAKRDSLGMKMAISVKGDMQDIAPFARDTNSAGHKRAAVRSVRRANELAASDGYSESSVAA